jgi:hypothetical protein
MKIIPVNASDRSFTDQRFILWVGEVDPYNLMIWADSLESATETMCDWVVDNAPGLLCDDAMEEEYTAAIAEGCSEEEAQSRAEADVTVFGHSGFHGILSYHWGVIAENPTRAEIKALTSEEES